MNKYTNAIERVIFEILKEISKKITDEVISLAYAFGLIIALVAVVTPHSPEWVGITLIVLYLITVEYSLKKKEKFSSHD